METSTQDLGTKTTTPETSDSAQVNMRQVDELIAQAKQCETEAVLSVWKKKAREHLGGTELGLHIDSIYGLRLKEIKAELEQRRYEEALKNPGKCGKHGVDFEVLQIPMISKIVKSCPACRKEEGEYDKAAAERSRQGVADFNAKRRVRAYQDAQVPDRFIGATLENYLIYAEGQKEIFAGINRFLKNWSRSTGIVFIGANGTGKNHLAAAIVKRWIDAGRTALMTKALKIFIDLRDAQHKGEIGAVIEKYTAPSLLIINELGVQHGTDFERNYLTDIIDDRYEWLRPTILIGNVTKDELAGIVGERIKDRFKEGGGVYSFTWDSYRGRPHNP